MALWEQMLHPSTTAQCYANHFWLWSINKASLSHARHWAMAHGPSDCKRNPWSSLGSGLGPLVWAPVWTQGKQTFVSRSHSNIWCKRDFLKSFPLVQLPPPGSSKTRRLKSSSGPPQHRLLGNSQDKWQRGGWRCGVSSNTWGLQHAAASAQPDWVGGRCRAPHPQAAKQAQTESLQRHKPKQMCVKHKGPQRGAVHELHVAFEACGVTWDLRTKQSSAQAVALPILALFWFLGPTCVTGTTGAAWKMIVIKVWGASKNADSFFGVWWDKWSSDVG